MNTSEGLSNKRLPRQYWQPRLRVKPPLDAYEEKFEILKGIGMAPIDKEPFPVRFGLMTGPSIEADFPGLARVGLWHILDRLQRAGRIESWENIASEVLRLNRVRINMNNIDLSDAVAGELSSLDWRQVYTFCERIYSILLKPEEGHDFNSNTYVVVELEAVRRAYESDLNQLLAEEGIVYRMSDGLLHRPGRLHSQRVTANAIVVLRDPRLRESRGHFAKAQKFFTGVPDPDFANAIKESVSALESALYSLFPSKSRDFEKQLKKITGANGELIPPTISGGIASLYRYRGAGQGVAHGGANGGRPNAAVAEWAMSVAASSIIYLRDLAVESEDEAPPF